MATPLAPLIAWIWQIHSIPHRGSLPKVFDKGAVSGFSSNKYIKGTIIFLLPLVLLTNCLHTVNNGGRNGIHLLMVCTKNLWNYIDNTHKNKNYLVNFLIDHDMIVIYGYVNTKYWRCKQMHLLCWSFWSPWQCVSAMPPQYSRSRASLFTRSAANGLCHHHLVCAGTKVPWWLPRSSIMAANMKTQKNTTFS